MAGDVVSSPGKILQEEFLDPLSISQGRLAEAMGMPRSAVSEIVEGRRLITAEYAAPMAEALGTSAEFWLRLEEGYRLRSVDPETVKHVACLV